MRRQIINAVLCGMALTLFAAGCSKKEETQETTAAEAAEEVITDLGEVTKLGEYLGVEVTKLSTEVTEEELETRIQSILDANPEYLEITDRAAKNGDVVNIDYVGMKDGVAFDGGTAEGYDLELGSGSFIDGFEDGLIGANVGEERSLNLTFPEDYMNADLAGQAVVFDVTVNAIKEKKDAVLDADFVSRVSDYTTVEEFREGTKSDLTEQKETQAEQQLQNDAFQIVLDASEFTLNEDAVEQTYQNQLSYYQSMSEAYGLTMESLAGIYGMTEEEFQEQLRAAAENSIRQELLVSEITAQEGLTVTDEDRASLAEMYGTDVETLQSTYGDEAVDASALLYKVVDLIVDNAVIQEE
ncbi:MAG: trigger factor [Clostridiales bacterium]|nr:trigger factor [Clostridiales bacterium]MCD8369128.1 trigger factor [Clostridiales bacterium]